METAQPGEGRVRILDLYPCLLVEDVRRSTAFYVGKLGFEHFAPDLAEGFLAGDFAMIRRDGAVLQLKAVPGGRARPNHTVHEWSATDGFLSTTDPDRLHAELAEAGVEIVLPPTDTTWATREFHFRDPDGYVFACGCARAE